MLPEITARRACRTRFRDPLRLIAVRRGVELSRSQQTQNLAAADYRDRCRPSFRRIHRRTPLSRSRSPAVSEDRWRAYIVRIPGVPTRADAVLRHRRRSRRRVCLCDWLTRASCARPAPAGPAARVGSRGCDPRPSRAATLTFLLIAWLVPMAARAQSAPLPRVRLVATGGTISNRVGGRLSAEELVRSMPGVERYARPEFEQFSNLASGELTLEQWARSPVVSTNCSRPIRRSAGWS